MTCGKAVPEPAIHGTRGGEPARVGLHQEERSSVTRADATGLGAGSGGKSALQKTGAAKAGFAETGAAPRKLGTVELALM